MRDVNRIEIILEKIKDLWIIYPDWRFCQLIVNILGIKDNGILFYIEDDELLNKLDQFNKNKEKSSFGKIVCGAVNKIKKLFPNSELVLSLNNDPEIGDDGLIIWIYTDIDPEIAAKKLAELDKEYEIEMLYKEHICVHVD